jgi:hypothetical protein
MALERLALGQVEERRHPLQGDPPFHAAVPPLRHRFAHPVRRINASRATKL